MNKNIIITLMTFLTVAVLAIGCSNGRDHDEAPIAYLSKVPVLLDAKSHGNGVGWGRSDCLTCHSADLLESQGHPRIVQASCMTCHLSNGTGAEYDRPMCIVCHRDEHLLSSATKLNDTHPVSFTDQDCVSCHKDTEMNAQFNISQDVVSHYACKSCHGDTILPLYSKSKAFYNGTSKHKVAGYGKITDDDCRVCHSNTDMNGVFDSAVDLVDFNHWQSSGDKNAFCISCHGNTKIDGMLNAQNIESSYRKDAHGKGLGGLKQTLRPSYVMYDTEGLACRDCHRMHTSGNIKLFIENSSEALSLSDLAAMGKQITATTSAHVNDLCATCHTYATGTVTQNGLQQVNHEDLCYTCHTLGAKPVIDSEIANVMNKNCISCHQHGDAASGAIHNRF